MPHTHTLGNTNTLLILIACLLFAPVVYPAGNNAFPREEFEHYISIFNQGDSDDYGDYYHPEVVMERGDLKLEGREAILAFYRDFHDVAKQTIEVIDYMALDDRIAVQLQTRFDVYQDWSHPVAGEMRKGSRQVNSFVHYWLRDGKIIRIQSARFRAVDL